MKLVQISEFAHQQASIEKLKRGGNLPDAIDRIVKNHLETMKQEEEAILFEHLHVEMRNSGEKKNDD